MHEVDKIFTKYISLVLIIFLSAMGCAANRGSLKRVQKPSANELRQEWKEYTVYYRPGIALVYQIKNDQKIILGKRWVKVSSENMMAKSKIFDLAWVREIIGNEDEMFGYLVHRYHDTANVKIIDQKTVQLYYHYVVTEGGP